MPGSIFIIQNDHTLVEVIHQPYATEDHLQRFLERYPSLPAGAFEMQPGHGAGYILPGKCPSRIVKKGQAGDPNRQVILF